MIYKKQILSLVKDICTHLSGLDSRVGCIRVVMTGV